MTCFTCALVPTSYVSAVPLPDPLPCMRCCPHVCCCSPWVTQSCVSAARQPPSLRLSCVFATRARTRHTSSSSPVASCTSTPPSSRRPIVKAPERCSKSRPCCRRTPRSRCPAPQTARWTTARTSLAPLPSSQCLDRWVHRLHAHCAVPSVRVRYQSLTLTTPNVAWWVVGTVASGELLRVHV